MRRQAFAKKPLGTEDLDLCFDCQAIWFDAYESSQLTAGAVLELFRAIDAGRQGRAPRPLPAALRCVGCRATLALTHDIERNNRFVYYRCPAGHGRFTTFLQFLREKDFVRSLTPAEIERLRATVAQVRCSSCGAPVDIASQAECPYCHAPIAILDADAMRRTLAGYAAAEERSHHVDPQAAIDALLAGRRIETRMHAIEGRAAAWPDSPVDLVHEALAMITGTNQEG
jgi:DNA-directed RNA polymerase subunit RPC12/RpoP